MDQLTSATTSQESVDFQELLVANLNARLPEELLTLRARAPGCARQ